jgi:hypothetical protein
MRRALVHFRRFDLELGDSFNVLAHQLVCRSEVAGGRSS